MIIAKYNLAGGVVGSYVDSYHGWATRRDYERAATCVSCHGAHSVLPEADSASSIHPDNVVATCRRCHAGADWEFAASYTHESASISANPVNRIIRSIYLVAIVLIIGVMVLHNLVIMNYYVIERRKQLQDSSQQVLRFDRVQVWQHLLLTVSFVVLVITGFALRFPEAWWVRYLSDMGLTEPVRSTVHRIAAVLLILVSLSHAYYVLLTRRGRKEFRSIWFTTGDVKDVFAALRFYTWRSEEKVKFGRYDYSQKAEYWALIWGTIMMIITGLILWWPELAVRFLPSLIVPAAQTIHYYEAILATLAILVWHFFFAIFHPEEYPMSWTWLTGRMSVKSVKQHHARWYEEEIAPSEEGPHEEAEATVGDQAGD